MPSLTNRAVVSLVLGGLASALALATLSPVRAGDGATALVVTVADPPAMSFDMTALGRATHPLRLLITNPGSSTVQVAPLELRFHPVRDGVEFSCDEARGGEETRWPATLGAHESFALSRQISCETPLPGRYDVAVRGRPRDALDAAERDYGSFSIQIDPGQNPPVRLPWNGALYAAASGTQEMQPTTDPNGARIVVAMINGTKKKASLAPVRATMRVKRRGTKSLPCAERSADLAFRGSLAPGRSRSLAAPLACDLSEEDIYDVDISLAGPSGARVHVVTHSIVVALIPVPGPRPEEWRLKGPTVDSP